MSDKQRRRGDRRDAKLARDLDSMHVFMPFLLPKRTDNEAVMNEVIDLTSVMEYIERKNAGNPDYKYTIFQVICAALAKTVYLRPKMNRFVSGHRTYDRNDLSFSFVVKKKFVDDAHESLAIMKMDQESEISPMDQFHDKLRDIVYSVRVHDKQDSTTDIMDIFKKLPRWLTRIIVGCLNILDYYGKVPAALSKSDPYNSTIFITNLGSIKMSANYHHLVNWGTNSFFVVVGEKYRRPYFREDGSYELRDALELGMTVDERIADGLYFAGSIRLLRRLLNEPELLELPFSTPVDYEIRLSTHDYAAVQAR
ncbi:MAG: 2-oxo acid dehydrogenase subunit E2 [Clostridiaceae bacterium]|nr:2-oxo acid dehydrogenase subunit E2 [Clostridiaceae bacterium]